MSSAWNIRGAHKEFLKSDKSLENEKRFSRNEKLIEFSLFAYETSGNLWKEGITCYLTLISFFDINIRQKKNIAQTGLFINRVLP